MFVFIKIIGIVVLLYSIFIFLWIIYKLFKFIISKINKKFFYLPESDIIENIYNETITEHLIVNEADDFDEKKYLNEYKQFILYDSSFNKLMDEANKVGVYYG